MARRLLTALVLAGSLTGGPTLARAALPAAPFVLSGWPSTTREGGEVTLELRGRADFPRPDGAVDLYVAVIQDGKFSGAYLNPNGQWGGTPEPYRRNIRLPDLDGLTLRFQNVNPAGWFTFRFYFLRPSAEKLNRKHYVLQPLDVTVRIETATGGTARDRLALSALAVFMLLAWIIVFRYPRRRPMARALPVPSV